MSTRSELIGIARSGRHRLRVRKAAKQLSQYVDVRPTGTFDVMVYFADTAKNLYQLNQWFDVLQVVNERHRVLIVTRSADAALALSVDPANPFPVTLARRHNEIDPLIEKYASKVVLYVNHHRANFAMLWHPDSLHVYIGHGDSDKIGISASNQLKAYDFTFVAGQAAIDRIERRLINFDGEGRLITVGRPQFDVEHRAPAAGNGVQTVLYAPSWEGDRVANSYGSVLTHGSAIVETLLADERWQLVFRPHPLSGLRSREYGQKVEALKATIAAANKRNPGRGHRVDTSPDFGSSLAEADMCVADVSAVALDALGAGKPVVVTEPAEPQAIVDPESVMSRLTLLPAVDARSVGSWLEDAAAGDAAATIAELREYCFGDLSPGTATKLFVDATTKVVALRDELISQR